MYESEKLILPEFPRTAHLPLEPNADNDDIIASDSDMSLFLSVPLVVEEKIDATNLGVAFIDGNPIVRNRSHILRKGYGRQKTPAQIQYQRVWTWVYAHRDKWERLNKALGHTVGVYGEWLYARHVVHYDRLPSLFVAYDVYDTATNTFLPPLEARDVLSSAGFDIVPLVAQGSFTAAELLSLRDGDSAYSTVSPREGVYLKSEDGTQRFKMVSPWFESDDDWNKKPLLLNSVCGKIKTSQDKSCAMVKSE